MKIGRRLCEFGASTSVRYEQRSIAQHQAKRAAQRTVMTSESAEPKEGVISADDLMLRFDA